MWYLWPHLRLSTRILRISHNACTKADASGSFSVEYTDSATGNSVTETFTHVVHATGLMSNQPFIPEFLGAKSFLGKLLHSSERRDGEVEFTGKNVVVVGNGKSAQDAALAAVQAGAAQLTQSVRQGHWSLPRRFFGLVPCASSNSQSPLT